MFEQQVTPSTIALEASGEAQHGRGALNCPRVFILVRQYDLPSYGQEELEVDYAFVRYEKCEERKEETGRFRAIKVVRWSRGPPSSSMPEAEIPAGPHSA